MRFAKQKSNTSPSDHYAVYTEYSKILRTWFVGYGVGGPTLILSQKDVWENLAKVGNIKFVAYYFILGVVLQVIIALLNKSIMWVSYYGEHKPSFKVSYYYKLTEKIARYYLIDLIFDISTTASYVYATYLCFQSLSQ